MKRLLWLIHPLALNLAFLIGGAYPGRPEEPPAVVRGQSARSGAVLRPGENAVSAVAFLKTLRSDPPPPPPPPPRPVYYGYGQVYTPVAVAPPYYYGAPVRRWDRDHWRHDRGHGWGHRDHDRGDWDRR